MLEELRNQDNGPPLPQEVDGLTESPEDDEDVVEATPESKAKKTDETPPPASEDGK